VTRGPRRVSTGDKHGYVDDCLTRADRAVVEDRMLEDPQLRKQIEGWLAQNEAIRTAFADHSAWADATGGWGGASRSRFAEPPRLDAQVVPIGEDGGGQWRAGGEAARRDEIPLAPAARPPSAAHRLRARLLAAVGGLAAALAVWAGAASLFADRGAEAFAGAATASYRTFAEGRARPVELATGDRAALGRWFAPQLGGAAPVPDLSGAGLTLLGGRIVPGAFAPAAFALYEDAQRNRVALQTEAADARSATAIAIGQAGGLADAAWTHGGRSFALVARAPPARLDELARRIREAVAAE
jgi:anti-sigma factor RsiW